MPAEIELSGLGELLQSFTNLEIDVDKSEDEALDKAADLVLAEAKKILREPTAHHKGNKYFNKAPADGGTGNLINSLKKGKVKKKNGRKSISVKATAPHAHLVELGTSRAPAHPFLRPARVRTYNEQVKVIEETVLNGANKAWRK